MTTKCPACHDVKLVGQSGAGLHMCKACCGPDADEFAFEILTRTIRDLQRANAFERAEIIDAWKAANGYDDLLKAYSDAVDRVAAYKEVLTTRREHERRADDRLNDALSGKADAVRRAESAELGCEIAYRREPTQAEGDAHEYRHEQSMGASDAIRECHVPMGNHHGHRCLCGRWVWGGPTVCQRCVDAEAVKAEWEKLFNERNRLWREEADRVGAVTLLLEANGCDCDCDHDAESHDADCDRCLACQVSEIVR